MTVIVTREGFRAETWTGSALTFEQLWSGQDLPIQTPLSLTIGPDTRVEDLAPWFSKLDLIVIPFASSADGRGFSLARRLRDLGYGGLIRAEGHVLVDQFRAALRVGFDEIAITDEQAARNPEAQWLAVDHDPGYLARVLGRSADAPDRTPGT